MKKRRARKRNPTWGDAGGALVGFFAPAVIGVAAASQGTGSVQSVRTAAIATTLVGGGIAAYYAKANEGSFARGYAIASIFAIGFEVVQYAISSKAAALPPAPAAAPSTPGTP